MAKALQVPLSLTMKLTTVAAHKVAAAEHVEDAVALVGRVALDPTMPTIPMAARPATDPIMAVTAEAGAPGHAEDLLEA